MLLPSLASAAPHIKAGKMRALGVTGAERSPLAPEIPTAAEAGLPGFQLEAWFGLVAPAQTPAPIVKRLNEELNAVLAMPEVKDLLASDGATPKPGTPKEFASLIKSEVERWTRLVREQNLQIAD